MTQLYLLYLRQLPFKLHILLIQKRHLRRIGLDLLLYTRHNTRMLLVTELQQILQAPSVLYVGWLCVNLLYGVPDETEAVDWNFTH
jgi:hypothetical protein